MRILVVGDSYIGIDVFARGLAPLRDAHELELLQIDETRAFAPQDGLREFAGSPDQLVERIGGVEVLVVHGAPVTRAVVEAGRELRAVCCARGGPVNVDVAAASARGLPVVTTPGKNAEAVADQTIAFMIMLARRFPKAIAFVERGGGFGDSAFEGAQFFGHELGGHVLGLVGFGQVGRRVAARAAAFGMTVLAYDPYVELDAAAGVEQVATLDELLARSHFVSLHARASAENENLFDAAAFAAMRPGAYFLNTARETLVDEAALDAALSSRRLAGAALDVLRPRSDRPHPLLRHENVVVTPHIGGATAETLLRGVQMIADEIRRLARGEPLVNVANRAAVGV